jgi:MATE family multidrug resistance protein
MSFTKTFASESRATLTLAIPIMAGQVSQMVMGLIDSAMVGGVGVLPLAASAFANNVLMVPFVFGIGLLTSLSVRASQSHGAGDNRESGEVLRHGMAMAAVAGLLMTFLAWVLSFHLDKFGQPADVVVEARTYLLLMGLSIVPAMLALGLKQFCEALNNPWPPTLILLAAVPLNVLFNWLLIYGNLGFPAMELAGAGYATLLARIIAFVLIVVYVWRSASLRPSLPVNWRDKWEGERFASLLRIGIPAALQVSLEVGAFALGGLFAGWLGKDSLAAHQIALACAGTTFMLPLGLAIATTIRIGQAIGSGDLQRVRPIGFNSFALALVSMALTATLFWIFADPIAGSFVKDQNVALLAARLLVITALFQLFDGLQVVGAGALRGLSDATMPMVFCFVAYWLVGVPLGYYAAFSLEWGVAGIWGGFALGLACIAVLLVWRFSVKSSPSKLAEFEDQPQIPTLNVH